MTMIDALGPLIHRYDIILCDIWGTLHDGVNGFFESYEALIRARDEGLFVALLTNSPMPGTFVRQQVMAFGLESSAYDQLITSGDCARDWLKTSNIQQAYFIGSARDKALFNGLDITLVETPEAAEVLVVSGLENDKEDVPDDYLSLLDEAMHAELPMLCVNPDVYIHVGKEKRWCAGALAKMYDEAGGDVIYTGKPCEPIFKTALTYAADMLGFEPTPERTLFIGDNPATDFQGALNQGFDFFLVGQGISNESDEGFAHLLQGKTESTKCVGKSFRFGW